MRAALLQSEGNLVITQVDEPSLQGPNQVLIQVKAVGICGSEVHAYEGTHPFRKAPVVLGHEMAGVVVSVGENVTRCKAGDRVTVDPQWTCGQCAYCRAGDVNLCPSKQVLGTAAWPGAFGEFLVVPEEIVFGLPDDMSFAAGCLIEPLTVAVHVTRRAGLKSGESVAILGSGAIGNLVCGVCRAMGAGSIVVADVRQHCLDAARECMGATHDFLLPRPNLIEEVTELTGGEGADVVFVTADDPHLVNLATEMAGRRGRIVLVALLTGAPLELTAYTIIARELQLLGSIMSTHQDVREALHLAFSGRVDVEGIISHVLPIEDARRGMELARTKDDGAIKVVLTF